MFTIIDDNSRNLLNLLLSDNPSQEALDGVLSNCFPQKPSPEMLLLLRNFQIRHPSLVFPDAYTAIFNGIKTYYLNSFYRLATHFKIIVSKMEQQGVRVVLIKGGAMFCLAPAFPRFMSDIDVLVKKEDFKKSVRLVKRNGYECDIDIHSADIHTAGSDEGILDIHRFILLTSGKGKRVSQDIISRASGRKFCGVDCLIPCHTDLLFIAVTNFSRNIMDGRGIAVILAAILDFKYLISAGIDWNMFVEDCVKTSSEAEVAFVATLVNTLAPGMFPKDIEDLANEKEKSRFQDLFIFRREILVPLQRKRSELLLGDVVRQPRKIPQFLLYRPLYFFLKLFKYSPRLNPYRKRPKAS